MKLSINTYPNGLKYLCWFTAAFLGLAQVISRYTDMNADGLSYLDMGDAYLRGDWHQALNTYWSPLYSWLLGTAMVITKPSPYWEFLVAHLVNYIVFLCTMMCFDFFLRELLSAQRNSSHSSAQEQTGLLPERTWTVIGYSFFIWSSLELIVIVWAAPDMCVAAFVYFTAGLTLRIRAKGMTYSRAALLGVALGVGYLIKAAMLPVGLAFLFLNLFRIRHSAPFLRHAAVVVILYGLTIAPFIGALSINQGRLTTGDSAKLNYSWWVNRNTLFMHWQGNVPGSGTPLHPTRKISAEPLIYEFATPVGGTFPPWYNPSYWHEGVKIYFDPPQQFRVIAENLEVYLATFFYIRSSRVVFLFIVLLLVLCGRNINVRSVLKNAAVLIPSILPFGMYALIIAEPRYIGAFSVVILLAVCSSLRLPQSPLKLRVLKYAVLLFPVFVVLLVAVKPVRGTYLVAQRFATGQKTHKHWRIADHLNQMGIRPGDKVASVGYSFQPYWARLGRTQVTAEMPTTALDLVDQAQCDAVITALARTGVKAVVANKEGASRNVRCTGWQQIVDTGAYFYLFAHHPPHPAEPRNTY